MNIEQRLQLHDRLYRHANRLIKEHNPCSIEGEKCLRGTNPCCDGCKYLGENGCAVECLMCKLYLCSAARFRYPKLSKILYRIQDQAFIHNILLLREAREGLVDHLNYMV